MMARNGLDTYSDPGSATFNQPACGAGLRQRISGRPLRIMHVTNSMALGGTEKVVLKLVSGLTDGFEHHVCCLRDSDPDLLRGRLRSEQFTALHMPHSRFAIFVPQLLRAIHSCSPDVVHSRNWGAIEAVFAARLAGVPVVIHSEHGYDVDGLNAIPLRQRMVRRLAYSFLDAFVTVSRELRDFHVAQAQIRRDKVRVLYNGVDAAGFCPNPDTRTRIRAEHGIAPEQFVIGAVGRMAAIKDYATLIRSAALLNARGLDFRLLLVGSGPELGRLLAQADAVPGLGTRVIALGQRDDIGELLTAMDAFVQTSLREGMSNTILEAMATGVPVAVTNVGGNPELVEDRKTGWLFEPGDDASLANILQQLATNPVLRQSAATHARSRAANEFSYQRMLDNYRRLYMELACKRKLTQTTDTHPAVTLSGSRVL